MMKDGTTHNTLIFLDEGDFCIFHSFRVNPNLLISTTGPDDFLEALRKFVSVRSAGSDNSLFMVSDKRTAQLDQSLSELNLVSLLEGDRCAAHKFLIKTGCTGRTRRWSGEPSRTSRRIRTQRG